MSKQQIFHLFLVAVLLETAPVQAKFSRTQEIRACPSDTASVYDGVLYQKIPLGISFKKLLSICSASHFTLSPEPLVEEENLQFVYKSVEQWPIGPCKWTPEFCFIDDNGVYRLASIRGMINRFDAFKSVTETLDNKYGKHSFNNQRFVWKIGSTNETAVMMDDSLPAWLYFHDVSLLKLGLAKKQRNAPGL